MNLTHERLLRVLFYDPESGIFSWNTKTVTRGRPSKLFGVRAGTISGAGKTRTKSYRMIGVDGTKYQEHRLAWFYMTGEWPASLVDHKDLDGLNNKWLNLREATHSTNKANRAAPANNTTGFKGVSFNKAQGLYQASICRQYKQMHLGFFDTAELAAAAYEKAARELFGEFARAS